MGNTRLPRVHDPLPAGYPPPFPDRRKARLHRLQVPETVVVDLQQIELYLLSDHRERKHPRRKGLYLYQQSHLLSGHPRRLPDRARPNQATG